MLTAFRHAANSIGIEAGVIAHHIHQSETEASVCGDHYYLELIREAELRLKRLRSIALRVTTASDHNMSDPQAMAELKEALSHD
jgi:hypothetical protein